MCPNIQVLPIERGAGLDQKLLLNFSRKLAAGGWCHIFPEGKTVQVRFRVLRRGRPASLLSELWYDFASERVELSSLISFVGRFLDQFLMSLSSIFACPRLCILLR